MATRAENRRSIAEEETMLELRRLQEAVKLASIHHSAEAKFEKRTDLTYIVHASLHGTQFVFTTATEIFHHVHHYLNNLAREKDDTIPALPEERNPIFYLYPVCMLVSLSFAIMWLVKKTLLLHRPLLSIVVCMTGAILMLVTGIMEMKHADMYIDIVELTDEEILEHPVFIHNVVMCILSIFVMTLYLLQTWVTLDYWQWMRREQDFSTTSSDTQYSVSSVDSDVTGDSVVEKRIDEHGSRQVAELAPIPTFEDLPAPTVMADDVDEDEKPILYCCFVDWYNYVKIKMEGKPRHEFQVVHVI